MDNLDNGSSSRQQASLDSNHSFQGSQDPFTLHLKDLDTQLDDVSLAILRFIADKQMAVTRDLRDNLHLSRGPIQSRLKSLTEAGYLVRSVKPGTERQVKPTYTYKLSPHIVEALDGENSINLSDRVCEESSIEIMAKLLEAAVQEIAELKSRISKLEKALDFKVKFNHKELFDKLHS